MPRTSDQLMTARIKRNNEEILGAAHKFSVSSAAIHLQQIALNIEETSLAIGQHGARKKEVVGVLRLAAAILEYSAGYPEGVSPWRLCDDTEWSHLSFVEHGLGALL